MKRHVEKRLGAMESISVTEHGPRVILLAAVKRDPTKAYPTTYRDCRHNLAWETTPGETGVEFEIRVIGEAEKIAKANNQVMLLAPC